MMVLSRVGGMRHIMIKAGRISSICIFSFLPPRRDVNRRLASADVRYIYSRSSLRRLKLNSAGLLEKATNKSLVPLVIEAVMVSLGRPCISLPSVINSCATLKSQPHSRGGRSPVGSSLRHKQRSVPSSALILNLSVYPHMSAA